MGPFVLNFGNTGTPPAPDGRLDAPAFHRNHEPIWNVLSGFLNSRTGDVLETGSGTGQHIVTYAQRAPQLTWWPSDIFVSHMESISAWQKQAGLSNLRAPQRVDLTDPDWNWRNDGRTGGPLTAMLCINVLHISPWAVSQNLIAGAARLLATDGLLFVYGPFMRDGAHTAPSNAAFDASLRAENPAWGVRDTRDLAGLASASGLFLAETVAMPANNQILVFGRPSAA